jgi:hypothetical protein
MANIGRTSYPYTNDTSRFYGSTSSPITSATAGAEFQGYRTACSATSGNSYGVRYSHKITGAAGEGAAIRGYAYAYGVSAGNLAGGEFTAEVSTTASSDVGTSAILAGVRAVASLNLNATGYTFPLALEFIVADTKAASATKSAFIQCNQTGAGTNTAAFTYFATTITTDPATALVSSHADTVSTHLVRCLVNATPMWLLATNAHA